MQSRLGPMEAGPYGSMQLVAEVGKWLQKEDIIPERPTSGCSRSPRSSCWSARSCSSSSCPSGPTATSPTSTHRHLLRPGRVVVSTIGVLIAGWSSANKYSLIGGLRAAGQLIAYELPMILAVVGVVIQAGTLNLQGIVSAQANGSIFGIDGSATRTCSPSSSAS
jgi:NADH-quinone oxidoreductase subunit H